MSKVELYAALLILTLLAQPNLLSAEETPVDSNSDEIISLTGDPYTDFVETTYNDPCWVLVISDILLRANTCVSSDPNDPYGWYEKVFNPCYNYNRYWKLAPGANKGRAFTMEAIKKGSLDSFYIPEGFGFQLYDGTTGEPCSPYLGGAKYVSFTLWRDVYPAPDGFEPGTFFVYGPSEGYLQNYSIIVCRYPLRLHKTHNAPPIGINQEDYVTYEISYFNQSDGLRDPCDPNSGPVDTNNVTITDFLPLEMDFNSTFNGGIYNSRFHTVTWNIGNLSIGDSGSVQLNVRVNRFAEPGSIISNYSEIKSGSLSAAAAVDVNVLYKPSIMTLTKVDTNAPDSVLPGDFINYRLTYGPNSQSHTNVRIVDYLPPEVDFTNLSDPNYDSGNHSYTWLIGSLSAGSPPASVMLTVRVNELAEPNAVITNHCKIESNSSYTTAIAETSVSPWHPDPPIIYVDNLAKRGSDTGMSWANAYLDLQDALERARRGYGHEIWVAEGTYKPTTNPEENATFQLVDGVALYGGFAGTETSSSQRNWLINQTILNGDIDNDGVIDLGNVTNVVTASNVSETSIIDGFTISEGLSNGILIDSASPIIRHNKIIHNGLYGIYCNTQSSPNITECNILNNNYSGIEFTNSDPNISLCSIKNNTAYGVYGDSSSVPVVKNNWIFRNGNSPSTCGIDLESLSSYIVIRNNTLANNIGYGIYMNSDAPITNCIVWGNSSGSVSPSIYGDNNVTYSCVQGDSVYPGIGNINNDPCFIDADDNNYHLIPNSPCIDKGDPVLITDPNETDIDGDYRVIDGDANYIKVVDMGADEFYWSPADFDRNEIVNFFDYALLASAWLNNDPNISLDDDNDVDIYDLDYLCDDWLWQLGMSRGMAGVLVMSRGASFSEALSTSAPPQQQTELQSEPQSLQPEPQPHLTEEDIQDMVDWLEQLWLTDEEVRKTNTEAEWLEFIEILKQAPLE
jgi:hypothetical protein